jgi:hypothetical protein
MMKRWPKIFLICLGLLLAGIVGLFIERAIERAGIPKYQGMTADEWVDRYARTTRQDAAFNLDELSAKELEVAFRSLGPRPRPGSFVSMRGSCLRPEFAPTCIDWEICCRLR